MRHKLATEGARGSFAGRNNLSGHLPGNEYSLCVRSVEKEGEEEDKQEEEHSGQELTRCEMSCSIMN